MKFLCFWCCFMWSFILSIYNKVLPVLARVAPFIQFHVSWLHIRPHYKKNQGCLLWLSFWFCDIVFVFFEHLNQYYLPSFSFSRRRGINFFFFSFWIQLYVVLRESNFPWNKERNFHAYRTARNEISMLIQLYVCFQVVLMVYLRRKLLRLQMIFLQRTKIKVVLWTTLCWQYMFYDFHFHLYPNICYIILSRWLRFAGTDEGSNKNYWAS